MGIYSKHKTSWWMLKWRRSVCPHGCFIGNIFVDCTSEEYYYLGTMVDEKVFGIGKYTHTNSTLSLVDIHYGFERNFVYKFW